MSSNILLCDVGNSFFKFLKNGVISKVAVSEEKKLLSSDFKNPFFISVNEKASQKLNKIGGINLNSVVFEEFKKFKSNYSGLGVDRASACIGIEEKSFVVVDAGSAITIDIVEKSVHKGGIILPGLKAYKNCYKNISPKLDFDINREVSLQKIPQSTMDAISFAVLNSIVSSIQKLSGKNRIYFTGGDGKYLSTFLENSVYDEKIVFSGILKVLLEKKVREKTQ